MALYLYWNPICGVHTPHYTDKNEYLLLLLLFFETKRSTPFTQKGVAKLTKMNIYYSFCSILRPKGVLLLLNTITKRSTPSTQKGVPKMTEMNIYYSFCSILRPKGVLLLLNIMTKRSTPFTQKGVAKLTEMNIYYSFCQRFKLQLVWRNFHKVCKHEETSVENPL